MSKIIACSGRMCSGKDLTASIIQRLDWINEVENGRASIHSVPSLEALTKGRLHSGKWQVKKFSAKLKEVASILTGIRPGKFEDQDFKKSFMGNEWAKEGHPMTVREFLQQLGSEAIRDNLHKNTWVNALFADLKPGDNWIITDMRYPNEFQAVHTRGGITIRIERDGTRRKNEHASEYSLDCASFHHVIYNNGSLEDLEQAVKAIMIKEGLL